MDEKKQELANEMRTKLAELNAILEKAFQAGLNHSITGSTVSSSGCKPEIEIELYEEIKY